MRWHADIRAIGGSGTLEECQLEPLYIGVSLVDAAESPADPLVDEGLVGAVFAECVAGPACCDGAALHAGSEAAGFLGSGS